MADYLPLHILAHFVSPEIPFAPPTEKLRHEKVFTKSIYSGVANYMKEFSSPEDRTAPFVETESAKEVKKRYKMEQEEQHAYKTEQKIAMWDPKSRQNTTQDPYKTLFVGRINYDTKESKLMKEFEIYGPIKEICLVKNNLNGQSRGYAFIEYQREKDMLRALKRAGGTKIDGHRVLVDMERGRTNDKWLPRKFGGGLGGRQDTAVKDIKDLEDNDHRKGRIRNSERSGISRYSRSRSKSRLRSKDRKRRQGSKSRHSKDRKHKRRSSRTRR